MTADEVLQLLRQSSAQQEGHFLLSSGLHSNQYLQCARVLEDPRAAERLGRELAARLRRTGAIPDEEPPQAVLSPALGGIIIGHEVARAAGARFLFTERDPAMRDRTTLRRGFALRQGERVVVVEDVVTTGRSTQEVIEVARVAGADVRAVAAIVDRSGGTAPFGVPFVALLSLEVPSFPPEQCELCRRGVPLEKPGSRRM